MLAKMLRFFREPNHGGAVDNSAWTRMSATSGCGLTRGQGSMQRTVPSCLAMAMRQQITCHFWTKNMLNSATNILPIYYQYFMAMRQRITMSFLDQRYVEYIGDIFVNILTTDGTETAEK